MSNVTQIDPLHSTRRRVTRHGQAITLATIHSAMLHHALEGDAYHVLTEVDLADGTMTPLAHVENQDSTRVHGAKRILSIGEFKFSQDANIHYEIFVGAGDYTSGGTDAVVRSLHRGASTDDVAVQIKDAATTPLVLDTTKHDEVESLFVSANAPYKMNDWWLLPKGKTLSIKAQGAAANKCRVMFRMFFLKEGDPAD